jgi:hypothetical protein
MAGRNQAGDPFCVSVMQPRYPVVGHDPREGDPAPENPPIPDKHYTPVPPVGSRAALEHYGSAFNPAVEMPKPRTVWERYRNLFFNNRMDEDLPTLSMKPGTVQRPGIIWNILGPRFPMKPDTYSDAYTRPNPCPEEFVLQNWRWPHMREVNPKVPPPVDGKYADFHHYFAFKQWLMKERQVYIQHCSLTYEYLLRCTVKEGPINAAKNCRHIANKFFAMTRSDEFNQGMLYMSLTGNALIRETPYPEDFIEQKRKIYDDWLFRTRQKRPGDSY